MARCGKAEKAKQLKRDHRAILDPEVLPSSAPAKRANQQAIELAIEYYSQPIAVVAVAATQGLSMIAKLVERSYNIQGPIRRDL